MSNKEELAASRAEIKPVVLDLADKIKKAATFDPKTGTATVEKDLYETLLPETVTKAQAIALQDHNTALFAAGQLALGELAEPAMKKHKDLSTASLVVPMLGKDTMDFQYDREKEIRNPGAKEGQPATSTKYGVSSGSITTYGTKSRGQLDKVKKHLSASALSAFGGK